MLFGAILQTIYLPMSNYKNKLWFIL